eukprot:GHVN01098939.1.p3 GENE.GHVN01098939.1~~GHVN01098939.1.p3  ORF type:complete len:103 (+),score=11.33 GHVN01098939.1:543-851(+)
MVQLTKEDVLLGNAEFGANSASRRTNTAAICFVCAMTLQIIKEVVRCKNAPTIAASSRKTGMDARLASVSALRLSALEIHAARMASKETKMDACCVSASANL